MLLIQYRYLISKVKSMFLYLHFINYIIKQLNIINVSSKVLIRILFYLHSTILNTCLQYLDDDNVIPIFILCDGKDHNKTAILGSIVQKNWLNTIEVTNSEIQALNIVKNGCSKLLLKHLKLSFSQPCDVRVFCFFFFLK